MDYVKVCEIIEEDYYKMGNMKLFLEAIGADGLEAIKEYCNSLEYVYNWDDNGYIYAFLKDMIIYCLNDYRVVDSTKYTEILYNLFKDY